MLFLGAAESGKSTICRHIRRIHGDKFSEEEILNFKHHIRIRCLESFINMIEEFLMYAAPASYTQQCIAFLEEYKKESEYNRDYLNNAITLWRIAGLQKHMLAAISPICIPTVTKSKRLHSDNPANHFLPSFSRIMAKGYNPTWEDILSVRIATTGTLTSSN